jgi:hypothetical protein
VIIRGDFVGALLELLGQHPEEPQRSAAGRNPKGKEPPVYLTDPVPLAGHRKG